MDEDTLLPDLPRTRRRYEVTVTIRLREQEDALVPLAAAALCAEGLVSAWTAQAGIVSMMVDAASDAEALAQGVAVVEALPGGCGASVTAEPVVAGR